MAARQAQQYVQQQPAQGFFDFAGFNFSDEFNAALDNQLNLNGAGLLGNAAAVAAVVVSNSNNNNNTSSSSGMMVGHCPTSTGTGGSTNQMVNSIVGLPSPPISSPAELSLPSPPSFTSNGSGGSPPGTPLTPIIITGPSPTPLLHLHPPGTPGLISPRSHNSRSSLAHSPASVDSGCGGGSGRPSTQHARHSSGGSTSSSVNDITSISSLQVRVSILQQRVSIHLMICSSSLVSATATTPPLAPTTYRCQLYYTQPPPRRLLFSLFLSFFLTLSTPTLIPSFIILFLLLMHQPESFQSLF